MKKEKVQMGTEVAVIEDVVHPNPVAPSLYSPNYEEKKAMGYQPKATKHGSGAVKALWYTLFL